MLKGLNPTIISGKEVLPIIEGGKGVAVTTGISSVNCDYIDENGVDVPLIFRGKTRNERHEELISHSIQGAISQARIAWETSKGRGRIHMNVLWEMGGCQRVLEGVLDKAQGMVHGVTCGAGMP